MDDILMSIIGIVIAVVLMFIFPLMTMADRSDDISQLTVKVATTEFADDVRTSGKLTPERYDQFLTNIGSTGNTYNVELEIRILDENPGKRETHLNEGNPGENVYYSVYNSQIIENTINNEQTYYLKEGDLFIVSVKNTNQTMSQQLKNFFYTVVGKDTYTVAATSSGIVTQTGR